MAAAKIVPPAAAPQAASQQAAAEVRSPEAKAQDAFEELRQFKGLATEDIAGRVQHVEAYLAEHGEAIVASRARQMLVELKRAARPGVSKDEPQPGGATAEGLAAPAGLPRFNAEQKEVIVRLIASLKGGDVLKLLGNAEKILREQTALPLGMVQEISAGIESIKNWIPKLHKHWESLKGQEATFEGSEGRSMTVEILKVVETAMHVRIVKSSIVKFKEGETWAFEREKLPPKIRAQVFLLFTPSAPEEQLLCAISECSQGRYENGLKILERCPTLKTTEPLREYFSSLLPEPKK